MILHNGDVLFGWPLQSHVITAGWFYNDGSLHRALDFRAAVGTPVYAAADGTVETAYRWNGRRTQGDTNSYGNMLKLRHADYRGGRLETLYAHLSKLCVAQAVTDARLEELTREVRAHNNFAQRVPVLEEQLRVANHRLSNLEKAHTPAGRAIS